MSLRGYVHVSLPLGAFCLALRTIRLNSGSLGNYPLTGHTDSKAYLFCFIDETLGTLARCFGLPIQILVVVVIFIVHDNSYPI